MARTLTLALALACAGTAEAAIFPVGTGLGCGYATVQAAIDHAQTYVGETPDVIRVSRTLTYSAQALKIGNQTVEIVGGFDDCYDSTPSGATTLSGSGGSADSVIQIQSNGRVTLRHLTISGGDEPSGSYGGGIDYRGDGVLELRDSSVINNQAGHGGGIYATGTGPSAELILGANVTISANVALRAGGGVLAEGLEMTMIEPGTVIAFNQALGQEGLGEGGGLLLRSANGRPGHAYIGSAGQGGLGAFYANQARYGGAIAVVGGNEVGQDVHLRLFSVSASSPVALRQNVATVGGGALYLRPDADITAGDSQAHVNAWHTVLDGNVAPEGSATFIDYENNGVGYPKGGEIVFNDGPSHPASIQCVAQQPCGRIVNHRTRDANNAATDGALFYGGADSGLQLQRVLVADNQGGRVVRSTGDNFPGVAINDSLIAGNSTTAELIRLDGEDPYLNVNRSTFAGNSIGAGQVLAGDATVVLRQLLVSQPGKTTLAPGHGSLEVENVIASETASLGGPPLAVLAAPRFVDPARGDYRLRAASVAVDFAPAVAGDDRDLLLAPRDQDIGLKRDVRGPRDIGAYERPQLLPLVLNGDFDADLNLWPVEAGGGAGWDGTQNIASGSGGTSGSLRIQRDAPPQPRVTGAAQCIHLPGPGRYLLNGYGRAATNPIGSRDPVGLHWEFRADGGEACSAGLATRSGDHVLATLDAWTRPQVPATIDVTEAEWSSNSSITIRLYVQEVGVQLTPSVQGWFDGITLDATALPEDSGLPFRDGFEG
jgi:hypothetical protein